MLSSFLIETKNQMQNKKKYFTQKRSTNIFFCQKPEKMLLCKGQLNFLDNVLPGVLSSLVLVHLSVSEQQYLLEQWDQIDLTLDELEEEAIVLQLLKWRVKKQEDLPD